MLAFTKKVYAADRLSAGIWWILEFLSLTVVYELRILIRLRLLCLRSKRMILKVLCRKNVVPRLGEGRFSVSGVHYVGHG